MKKRTPNSRILLQPCRMRASAKGYASACFRAYHLLRSETHPSLSYTDLFFRRIRCAPLQAELVEEMALNDGIPDDQDDASKVKVKAIEGPDAGVACTGCRHNDVYLRSEVADFHTRANMQMKAMKSPKKKSTILDHL